MRQKSDRGLLWRHLTARTQTKTDSECRDRNIERKRDNKSTKKNHNFLGELV